MNRSTKATKIAPKATTPAVAPAAPKALKPCNMVKVVSHYRHQLHRHLVDRGDNEAVAMLLVITSLESVRADQEATA